LETPSENFWKNKVTEAYIEDNKYFNQQLGIQAWNKILKYINIKEINNLLECGSNIGRNIDFLNKVLPHSAKSIIEIAKKPFDIVNQNFKLESAFHGSIKEASFPSKFDLVFTSGVLIHIDPTELLLNMKQIYNLSSKYIILNEYFSRTPAMIEYRGEQNKLFKNDFGRIFIENFNVKLINYGFLWGKEYDSAGFDDTTYWVFKKLF
jgi:pseudaminic acid biosynthesis-associated methylase